MRRLAAAAMIVLAVYGCGGDNSPVRSGPSTTTAAPSPSTTLSPDAQLAVKECQDALTQYPATIYDALRLGVTKPLDEAIRTCSNASDHATAELGKDSPLAVSLATVQSALVDLDSAAKSGQSLEYCSPTYQAFFNTILPANADLQKHAAAAGVTSPTTAKPSTRTTTVTVCQTTTSSPPKKTAPTLAKTSVPTSKG
jgi:hypothetical protein